MFDSTEIRWYWFRISTNHSSRRHYRIHLGSCSCKRRGETYYSSFVLYCLLDLTLLPLNSLWLTYAHEPEELLRHSCILELILQWFRQSYLNCIFLCEWICVQICCNHLKLRDVVEEQSVLLFKHSDLQFHLGHIVGIFKSCFQEFNKRWLVSQPYCCVLPDMWLNLNCGYPN